ncbi:MAG TPA: hypothetical protein VK506_10595, partial [Conexibacter sp.]|nr:hypothetical protein [Conexibacter sp.]
MSSIRRTLLLAALALAALGLAASPAAAAIRGLSIGGGAISQASSGPITFAGGLFEITCNLTVNGT